MLNRFINDMTRDEILEELVGYRDVEGLDHVADAEGRAIDDPASLTDDVRRELLKLARWRALLWAQQDE